MSNNPNANDDDSEIEQPRRTADDAAHGADGPAPQPGTTAADDAGVGARAADDEPEPESEQRPEPRGEPTDDDDRADPSDFFVARDESGDLLSIKTRVGQYGMCEIKPMTYGHAQRYFGDVGGAAMAGPETICDVLRNHVIDPDFDQHVARNDAWRENRLTARIISEEMEPFGPAALLQAILEESGLENVQVDMNQQGEATVDFSEEGN